MSEDAKFVAGGILGLCAVMGLIIWAISCSEEHDRTWPCNEFAARPAAHVPVRCLREFGVLAPPPEPK